MKYYQLALISTLLISADSAFDANAKQEQISWETMISSCNKIYEGGVQKWLPLNLFDSLPQGFQDFSQSDGVRFKISIDQTTKYRKLTLVAVYGVDDCSEGSPSEKSGYCASSHPPTISFLFVGNSKIKLEEFEPVELRPFGEDWYDMSPGFLEQLKKVRITEEEKLYEFTCMWYSRPKAG